MYRFCLHFEYSHLIALLIGLRQRRERARTSRGKIQIWLSIETFGERQDETVESHSHLTFQFAMDKMTAHMIEN
jgi:hypothetical protein